MKKLLIIAMSLLSLVVSGESFAGQKSKIISLCNSEMNMPGKMCDCLGEESSVLSEQERSMVIAMLSKDKAAADKLRSTMPVNSALASSMFIVNTPNKCARKLESAN